MYYIDGITLPIVVSHIPHFAIVLNITHNGSAAFIKYNITICSSHNQTAPLKMSLQIRIINVIMSNVKTDYPNIDVLV